MLSKNVLQYFSKVFSEYGNSFKFLLVAESINLKNAMFCTRLFTYVAKLANSKPLHFCVY